MSATAKPLSAPPATIERRFYPRIVPLEPIYISMGAANPCLLLNVSENGLLISTPTELRSNYVARIALPLNGLPKPVEVKVRVIWVSGTTKLAGIQLTDLNDHDRQQIRKWSSCASTPTSHREVQREPSQSPAVYRPFPARPRKPTPEPSFVPNLSVSNPAATEAFSPSTTGGPSPSRVVRAARWIVPVALLSLVGVFLLQSGAMQHSFVSSSAIPKATPVGPSVARESRLGLQSPDNPQPKGDDTNSDPSITSPSPAANVVRPKATMATTLPKSIEPVENHVGSQNVSNSPPHSEGHSRQVPPAAVLAAATSTLASGLTNPAPSNTPTTSQTTNSSALSSVIPAFPSPPVVLPNPSATLPSRPTIAPLASAQPRNPIAPAVQQAIQMDPPARQSIEIHLPNGYHSSIFEVPGERVLESSAETIRIQRSVLLPSTHSLWPFHHNTNIVVGGLIYRVDPQVAPVHTGPRQFVRVHATVAQDGHITSVRPIAGSANLMPAALQAVHEWRYQPTFIDGKPVESQADILIQLRAPPSRAARP